MHTYRRISKTALYTLSMQYLVVGRLFSRGIVLRLLLGTKSPRNCEIPKEEAIEQLYNFLPSDFLILLVSITQTAENNELE